MNHEQDRSIQRLLGRHHAEPLLESFARLTPHAGLALLRPDHRLFVRGGSWPANTLQEMLAHTGAIVHSAPLSVPDVTAVDGYRFYPLRAGLHQVGTLVARGPSSDGNHHLECFLHAVLTALLSQGLEKREVTGEALACYREINLLYRAGETIGGSLDPDAIPQLVLDQCRQVIQADAGVVSLGDIAASFGESAQVADLRRALDLVIDQLWQSGRPAILTDLTGAGSVWSAMLWALRTPDRVLGGIVLGRRAGQPVFVANDQKLMMALAAPSALALQNANLFADLQRTLNETLEMKTLMDDVFASIASGVLTTDRDQRITLCNEAVARVLGLSCVQTIGRRISHVLAPAFSRLTALIAASAQRGAVTIGETITAVDPTRGSLHLYVSCTPVRDAHGERTGAAVVINDMTERRKLEAERERIRQTFGRVVAPRVRDRLLAEPENLRLDGSRHMITVLFADLHGFTSFCERTAPETLFKVLNSYLSLAADAVLAEEGTLDKFIGDAVMAFWNAPDTQPDHALRAVRAAFAIEKAMRAHRNSLSQDHQLQFSIGVSTGDAIVGNVGTAELFNYTVIGDTVNLAQRLESIAKPGRILLSEATYREVADRVTATALPPMSVKGREEPAIAFELCGLV
jgi:adenylate cyclase